MTAYYNEIDPFAAQWLRNLVDANLIAAGDVDERSIEDVKADDIEGYTQCHFFAGIGVWSYALRSAGWPDERAVWTGSCPCQPFSASGSKHGFDDRRHLWPAWYDLIAKLQPRVVFGEQVASPDGYAWLDAVHADLEAMDYACGPVVLPAAGFGAPHSRHRIFFVADTHGRNAQAEGLQRSREQRQQPQDGSPVGWWDRCEWLDCSDGKARPVEPGTLPLANGLAARVGQLRAYGNAIVAPVAAEFVAAYMDVRP